MLNVKLASGPQLLGLRKMRPQAQYNYFNEPPTQAIKPANDSADKKPSLKDILAFLNSNLSIKSK